MIELFRFISRMQPEFYFSSTNTLYCCKGTLLQIHRKQLVFQEISVVRSSAHSNSLVSTHFSLCSGTEIFPTRS